MRTARHRARELALQALYQWRLTGYDMAQIEPELRGSREFGNADAELFTRLVRGVPAQAAALEQLLQPLLDRPVAELSPVERCILLLGAYELKCELEVPYRVVINEGVELAKTFGGTDGHKYVNGVLDKLAGELRAVEVAARAAKSSPA